MAGMGPMKVLGHISESMAGVSAQHVKIDASSARDGLKPSSSIAFSLPQNALIDLDTLAIHGKVTVTKGRMPSAMSLIERFEVSIGGQVISGGSSFYGIAQAMLEANTGCRGDLVTEHGIVAAASTPYQGEHSVGAAGGNEVSKVTWSNFKTGFFGTCGTRVLDTSRLPIITFRITWAPIKVLVDAAATGYQIDNVFATMSVLTVSNPMYTAMQDAVISSKGFLPLPFKEFSTIRSTNNGIVRASCSSRSLDRVHVAYQAAGLDAKGPVVDSLAPFDGTIETLFPACETFCPNDAYKGTTADVTALDSEFYLELGGVRYPQFRATLSKEWAKINRDNLYDEEHSPLDPPCGIVQVQQKNVSLARLNLPGSNSACYSTGVNTSMQSLIIQANNTDFIGAITYISSETTPLLMVSAAKEITLSR